MTTTCSAREMAFLPDQVIRAAAVLAGLFLLLAALGNGSARAQERNEGRDETSSKSRQGARGNAQVQPLRSFRSPTALACKSACDSNPNCQAWSWERTSAKAEPEKNEREGKEGSKEKGRQRDDRNGKKDRKDEDESDVQRQATLLGEGGTCTLFASVEGQLSSSCVSGVKQGGPTPAPAQPPSGTPCPPGQVASAQPTSSTASVIVDQLTLREGPDYKGVGTCYNGCANSNVVLETGRQYVIEVSGTLLHDESNPATKGYEDMDAVWTFGGTYPNPFAVYPFGVDGKQMKDLVGQDVPYNPAHVYRINYIGQGRKVAFNLYDDEGASDHPLGGLKVVIYSGQGGTPGCIPAPTQTAQGGQPTDTNPPYTPPPPTTPGTMPAPTPTGTGGGLTPTYCPPDPGLLDEQMIQALPDRFTEADTMFLQAGQQYVIEAAGTIDYWNRSDTSVDPVWCFAAWRCPKMEQWQSLQFDGKGMKDLIGQDITYNPGHVYRILYTGQGKAVRVGIQGAHSSMHGAFRVRIYDASIATTALISPPCLPTPGGTTTATNPPLPAPAPPTAGNVPPPMGPPVGSNPPPSGGASCSSWPPAPGAPGGPVTTATSQVPAIPPEPAPPMPGQPPIAPPVPSPTAENPPSPMTPPAGPNLPPSGGTSCTNAGPAAPGMSGGPVTSATSTGPSAPAPPGGTDGLRLLGRSLKGYGGAKIDAGWCKTYCDQDSTCVGWTYVKPAASGAQTRQDIPGPGCYLMTTITARQRDSCCTSGEKPAGTTTSGTGPAPAQPPPGTGGDTGLPPISPEPSWLPTGPDLVITSVYPPQAAPGTDTEVTVTGQNFTNDAIFGFENLAIQVESFSINGATQAKLRFKVPAKAGTGATAVYMTTPDGRMAEAPFMIASTSASKNPPPTKDVPASLKPPTGASNAQPPSRGMCNPNPPIGPSLAPVGPSTPSPAPGTRPTTPSTSPTTQVPSSLTPAPPRPPQPSPAPTNQVPSSLGPANRGTCNPPVATTNPAPTKNVPPSLGKPTANRGSCNPPVATTNPVPTNTLNLQAALSQLKLSPGTYTSPTVLASVGLTIVANASGTPGAAGTGSLFVVSTGGNEVHSPGTTTEAFFYGPGIAYNVLNCTTLAWTGPGSLTAFTITRPGMANGASIPAWAMYAYDASGKLLSSTSEGNLTNGSFTEPPNYADFTVSSSTPIAKVVFCSHNGSSTYNALPLSGAKTQTASNNPAAPSVPTQSPQSEPQAAANPQPQKQPTDWSWVGPVIQGIGGIVQQSNQSHPPSDATGMNAADGVNLPGYDYSSFYVQPRWDICQAYCANDQNCRAFTYVKPQHHGENAACYLKTGYSQVVRDGCCISGVKNAPNDGSQPQYPQPASQTTSAADGVNLPGYDYVSYPLSQPRWDYCQSLCVQDQRCMAFTYVKPGVQERQARCWLKSAVPQAVRDACCISGAKNAAPQPPRQTGCGPRTSQPAPVYSPAQPQASPQPPRQTGCGPRTSQPAPTPPPVRQPQGGPPPSAPASRTRVRIKVIAGVSCSPNDQYTSGFGGVTVNFSGTPVTTGSDGVTRLGQNPGEGIAPGTYRITVSAPRNARIVSVRLHMTSDSGLGNIIPAAGDGSHTLTFANTSNPGSMSEYELAIRFSSPAACN